MVSIVAFQAVDPGSIPGRRRMFFFSQAVNKATLNKIRTFKARQMFDWKLSNQYQVFFSRLRVSFFDVFFQLEWCVWFIAIVLHSILFTLANGFRAWCFSVYAGLCVFDNYDSDDDDDDNDENVW